MTKILRFLVRLSNERYDPKDIEEITKSLRASISKSVRVGGIRVSKYAIEFDAFAGSDTEVKDALSLVDFDILTLKRLDIIPQAKEKEKIVQEAKIYFNEERFWECHEVLEPLWKSSKGEEKSFLHGMILVAAAFVHHQKNEPDICLSILRRAGSKFQWKPERYYSLDAAVLFKRLDRILVSSKIETFRI